MGPVLLGCAHRHDQAWPLLQPGPHRARGHLLDPPRLAGLSHRGWPWVVVVLAAGVSAAEWLRRPGWVWVIATAAALLALVVLLWPLAGWRRRALAAALTWLVAALVLAQVRLTAIERDWPAQRKARVTAASERLAGDLHTAFRRAERLAAAAAATPAGDRSSAFAVLDRLVPARGPEMSVVILDAGGLPWAWAGRHRLPPQPRGDSIGSRSTGYYVVLEARRHTADGRMAVAGVLIWAHPAVPDRGRSLAELFRARTEVGLTVYPSGSAPDSADVFDYQEPTTAGSRLLFSVRPVPPEQGAAKELVFHRGSRLIVWLVLASFMVALTLAATPAERFVLLSVVL